MNRKRKGDDYERKVLNNWIDASPKDRLGFRCAGSMSRGELKIDLVLIDLKWRRVQLVQCKNSKAWTLSRKLKHTKILQEKIGGEYRLEGWYV